MVTAKDKQTYGHSETLWAAAKSEAKSILRRVARSEAVISYGELVKKIDSVRFEPHSHDPWSGFDRGR